MEIKLFKKTGNFAENKDVARTIRIKKIIPAIENTEKDVIINFEGIDSATQSFMHALISDLFRNYGVEIFDRVKFKSCNETVQKIIGIVFEYMQESDLASDI